MGVLLDTHALLWWHEKALFWFQAGLAVLRASSEHNLFVSPITAWEIAVANTKKNVLRRPPLRGLSPQEWFDSAVATLHAEITNIGQVIALEAASIGKRYGSHDPGDCFLLATAHLLKVTLITRDADILRFAKTYPTYVSTIGC